ncbi:11259_t:CDS:2 [Entrophospora sp. SA101]|nr:11259_t:CDS:2 [Entrophospora sp. SA101]CAJ0830854.1 14502_t:CDS:2 [Entrophospora sp. SA101]
MISTDQLETIHKLIFQEKRTITYKWLSRHLGLSTNQAKMILSEFITTSNVSGNSIRIIYCLCGRIKDNEQQSVMLILQDELEATKKLFDELTSIHVYSIGINCTQDASALIHVYDNLKETSNSVTLDVKKEIKQEEIKVVEVKKTLSSKHSNISEKSSENFFKKRKGLHEGEKNEDDVYPNKSTKKSDKSKNNNSVGTRLGKKKEKSSQQSLFSFFGKT